MPKLFSILLAVFIICTYANAQDTNDVQQEYDLEEVTVNGENELNKQNILPAQKMTATKIKTLPTLQVSDVLKFFSGTIVRDYGGIGGLKTVSIRSLGASHTAVEYDGITIGNMQTGQVDLGRVSINGIDNIFLYNGQSGSMLQSARSASAGGVIAIHHNKPIFDEHEFLQGNAIFRVGSFGFINPSLSLKIKCHDKVSLSLNGDYQYAEGTYPYTINKQKFYRTNSDINQWKTEANLFYTINNYHQLTFKIQADESDRGLPGAVIYYNPFSSQRLTDKNYLGQLIYNFYKRNSQLTARAKYNYAYTHYLDPNFLNSIGKQEDTYQQQEGYLSTTFNQKFLYNRLQFSVANDFFVNHLDATLTDFAYPTRYSLLNLVQLRFASGGIMAQGSLLSSAFFDRVKVGNNTQDSHHLSPMASFSWRLVHLGRANNGYSLIDQQLTLRAFYKNIFRMPTFNDLYYTGIGNTDLKPERVNQFDLGISFDKDNPEHPFHLYISADAYYNNVKDKIVAIPTKNIFVWSMINFGKVSIFGSDITLNAKYILDKAKKYHIQSIITYTFQHAIDMTDPSSKTYKNQIPYTPKHSGSGTFEFKTPWFSINYTLLASSRRYTLGQNIESNKLPGYCEHSLSFSMPYSIKSVNLELIAEVQNIGNNNYQIIANYPMQGRSFKLTTIVDFKGKKK